ncbi:hypothetical protein ACMXN5_48750 [Embleya sp. MST-111070]
MGGIRPALPEARREEFDEIVYDTPPEHPVRRVALEWALPPETTRASRSVCGYEDVRVSGRFAALAGGRLISLSRMLNNHSERATDRDGRY